MADIELVIKIPEDYYNAIKEIPVEQSTADMLIIRNGTPIPIGHGDLIDANKEQMLKYGYLAPDMTVTEYVEDFRRLEWREIGGNLCR